ncbi:sodium:proton antiporter [Hydrogenophaga sp.]|uniref:cation:proton antiporter n=1 Tax=Hydrogenophaga sp. TaxID=1904254 RepID=UPI00271920EB|nr:cation:proton antiporter [Hydrogenophaga sp.]MDO9437309.1 cation:proton antiporter [Hydrogenophaga sp.]
MTHVDPIETIVVVLVITLLVISAAATVGPRLRVPPPLILVAAGIGVSLIPGSPDFVIDPQIILLGLLPPLLYASATSISVISLRRELSAVNALSVTLVVLTSLLLGGLFVLLIPGLGYGWGVALGAILSPTDAVAAAIIKGRGVPSRVAVILDGESLLNDASALIVLRTAIVATSLGFSFWPTVGNFVLSLGVAVVLGALAAHANLAMRRRVRNEAVSTILSFTTPFLAAVPAELLHGSGLVAAVVAGFVVGTRGPRDLPPGHRLSDARNWATVEMGAEGVVFLTMGLQLSSTVHQLALENIGMGRAFVIALAALVATLVIRTAFVAPLLWGLRRRARRAQNQQAKIRAIRQDVKAQRALRSDAQLKPDAADAPGMHLLDRMRRRGRRYLADIDYLASQPLGRAEGTLVVWAGMRGAVTVAAAQLLPAATPHRPLLIFVAFAVAASSLLIQGGTVGLLVSRLFAGHGHGSNEPQPEQQARVEAVLKKVRAHVARTDGMPDKQHRLEVLRAQRNALLNARDDGWLEAAALEQALRDIDIDEMVLEWRSGDLAD